MSSSDFLDKDNLKSYMMDILGEHIRDILEGVTPSIPPGKTQVITGKKSGRVPAIPSSEYCKAQGIPSQGALRDENS